MTANEYQEKMDLEISKRMNNPEWDFNIASRVISKRNKKIKRNLYALSSFSLMATAAVIIFAVFVNGPSAKVNDLEIFISKQVEGTHKEVFREGYSNNLLYVNSYEDANNHIDTLIDNALLRR